VRAEASRGCPWGRCNFCVVPWKYAYSGWRPFPVELVAKQIEGLSDAGAKVVYFTDEEFIGPDLDRMFALVRTILELKRSGQIRRDLLFFASTSVRAILGKQTEQSFDRSMRLLEEMKHAGFIGFFLGVESGSDAQLERYNKGVTANDNRLALKILSELGMEVDVGFIMFDPETSLRDLQNNLDFMESTGLTKHYSRFAKRLRIVPKTPFETICSNLIDQKLDLDQLEYDWSFKCAEISAIYNVFHKWENINICVAYKMQSRIRSEIADKHELQDTKIKLCMIRNIDYDFLCACGKETGKSINNIDGRLEEVYKKFLKFYNNRQNGDENEIETK
jgi:hypothetical protein